MRSEQLGGTYKQKTEAREVIFDVLDHWLIIV